jgi:hypothetical protein
VRIGLVDGEPSTSDVGAVQVAHLPDRRDAEIRVGRPVAGGLRGNERRLGASDKQRATDNETEREARIDASVRNGAGGTRRVNPGKDGAFATAFG